MQTGAQPAATRDRAPAARDLLLLISILLVTAVVYARTLGFDFVYDDYAQIVETKQLNSWHMIPHYFTGHVWSWKSPNTPGPYYRPVFLLWLLANQALFDVNSIWWHLTSVLVHCAATALLFMLALRLTRNRMTAAVAALLFGVHPVHLESVAWVSGITEPLLAVLFLGALIAYLDGARWWPLALYTAALLEKETAIVLPALVFVHELCQGQRPRLNAAFFATLPYVAISTIYLGVRYEVLHGFALVITPLPWRWVVETSPAMLVFYLRHLAWPVGLSVWYTLDAVSHATLQNFWLPLVAVVFMGAGLLLWAWKSHAAALSGALLVLPILPVLNIRSFAHFETVHDRYLYLPSAGFCILAALALSHIRLRWIGFGLAGAAAAALGYGAFTQAQYWQNNITLFQRGLDISPNNEIPNQGMGTSLMLKGQPADAVPYYKRAIELQPAMFESLYGLGRCYFQLDMCAEAQPYLLGALRLQPDSPKPMLYYGLCALKLGDLRVAEAAIREAIRVKGPDDYREYHLSLGLVLKQKGDIRGALSEFRAEARENPDPTRALNEISNLKR